ncbi:MAG: hypothetical protein OJF60_003315 [Burkholderiaceae bacterium]|jgi:hypothetical protein|nr:MAG: hypothetical protein OJF60_003315 [Burkholderiaceae bacterium]
MGAADAGYVLQHVRTPVEIEGLACKPVNPKEMKDV